MGRRNPYAKSLRLKPQQVIPDKRDKAIRQIWDETVEEELPPHLLHLLERMG